MDARFRDGDVDIFEGDMVVDHDPLAQSIVLQLHTTQGTHFYYQEYGRKTKMIGSVVNPKMVASVMDDLYEICQRDWRVHQASIRMQYRYEGLFAYIKAGERAEFEVGL